MRLAYLKSGSGGAARAALVRADNTFVDVAALLPAAAGLSPLEIVLDAGRYSDEFARAADGLSGDDRLLRATFPADAPLLAPIPRPNRILAIGRNYAEHARELGNAVPDDPIVFLKASTSVVGPGGSIAIPDWAGRVDFEGELLVVIGKGGSNIAEREAMGYVAAYSVFNDVTARERQRAAQEKKHPWFLAKSLDTFGPLGPFLVTADEIPDPHALRISLQVNGETRQDDTTGSMIYRIPFLIAYLSRWFALEAGDVIATGTPSGVGPLVPGDVVEVTVDKIGTLRNPVVGVSGPPPGAASTAATSAS